MTRSRSFLRARFAVALVAVPALLAACSGGGASAVPTAAPSGTAADNTGGYPAGCPTTQPAPLGADETRTVTINTGKGAIAIQVKGSLSPVATGNFVALADCGYYDGVTFHRIVPGFVIQGGDGEYGRASGFDRDRVGSGGPPYTIKDEPVTATYGRGVVAMARSSQPNSVGSQFFIVLADDARSSLESANTYQIIGTVTSGMDAVDAIAAAADQEIPSKPVVMTDVSVATP